jgi:hypothetical protein
MPYEKTRIRLEMAYFWLNSNTDATCDIQEQLSNGIFLPKFKDRCHTKYPRNM